MMSTVDRTVIKSKEYTHAHTHSHISHSKLEFDELYTNTSVYIENEMVCIANGYEFS